MSAPTSPLLSVRNLSIDYLSESGTVQAVTDVNFDVQAGQSFGLAGESGSGKSTIVQGLLRLLQPPAIISSGDAFFEGENIFDMDEKRLRNFRWRKMSLVFQSAMNALHPVMRIGEQITDVIDTHLGDSRESSEQRAIELLDLVGIPRNRLHSFPHELSGGMRQRVVIAIALALRPPLLLLDEPTTALDVIVQREILERLAELRKELGFAMLFITHDLTLMMEFCDDIGILYAGRLVEQASSPSLIASAQHPYTQGLIAATPELSSEIQEVRGIPGSPPDLQRPPPGCPFAPRCTKASSKCESAFPVMTHISDRHRVACHHGATRS